MYVVVVQGFKNQNNHKAFIGIYEYSWFATYFVVMVCDLLKSAATLGNDKTVWLSSLSVKYEILKLTENNNV